MDLNTLKRQVALGEDSDWQFKENVTNANSLASEIVAFSNATGGQLLIGVTDQRKIKGLFAKDVARINQLISNAASQHVKSPVTVQTKNIAISKTKFVILVTIQEGIDKPYFDQQGIIWLKAGSDKRRINSKEELRRWFQSVDALHADEIPTRLGLEAIDWDRFRAFLKENYGQVLPKSKSEQLKLLRNLSLATDKNINLAGLLLFGQEPQNTKPAFIVKAISYFGPEITQEYLSSEDIVGRFERVFKDSLAFISRYLHKIQGKKSVNSVGTPEIPMVVFEELLVNALVHRDYFIQAPIRIFVYSNRIEIISPGCLPNHLDIEKVKMGNSVQRNSVLASFVAKEILPYRGLGTGIRRVFQEWPNIELINDREGMTFTAIVWRRT